LTAVRFQIDADLKLQCSGSQLAIVGHGNRLVVRVATSPRNLYGVMRCLIHTFKFNSLHRLHRILTAFGITLCLLSPRVPLLGSGSDEKRVRQAERFASLLQKRIPVSRPATREACASGTRNHEQ